MNPRIVCISALGTMLMSGGASAVGFGDIVLLSRVGEPLRAEVPILTNSGETIESPCFSLAAIRNSDLPVISSARFRLNRSGTTATLTITGTQPIAEPIFVIGLRANCGIDLQRDYVLMPQPPMMLAEANEPAAAPIAAPATRKSRNFREWTARRGDTLESIAESQSAGDLAEQQRLLTALKRANPDIVEYEALTEGRTVRIPNLVRRTAERPAAAQTSAIGQRADSEPPPPPRPKKARPAAQPAVVANTGGADRIVLGAAPEDIRPAPKPAPAPTSASEVEERMLRLETTLNSLNQEVEKLNVALALATEALAVQQKLMTVQSQQSPAAGTPPVQVAPPPTPAPSSPNNWLELLLSALVGGGLAAGLAHFFSRRPSRRTDELPLVAFATPREAIPHPNAPDIAPGAAPPAAGHAPAALSVSPTTVDIPLTLPVADLSEDQRTLEVSFNDGNSALELAEIMLSFGRIRGAAETLAMHIEENAPDNVQPWTMLLDLYRRGDMRSEFEALAAQMRTRFNIRIPSWEESTTPVSGLKALEDYAHIVWRITNCWGEQECMDYLHDLVHDNRAGNRSGFPLEVVEEIVLLMHVLEEGYGLGGRG